MWRRSKELLNRLKRGDMLRMHCWVPVPEAGKWKPRPVLLLHVVLLVFQAHVVARQQQGHAHATLAQRWVPHHIAYYIQWYCT
jgi:hypothetical protein